MVKDRKGNSGSKEHLPVCTKLGFGTGHVLADFFVSMFISYLLLFFNRVLGLNASLVGLLMVIAQAGDAFFALYIGYFQDYGKDGWLCRKYNKRKAWHLVGTCCLMLSLPLLFNPCIGCQNASDGEQAIYYAILLLILDIGYGCVQISHLALITDMTANQLERTSLISYRHSAKIVCNLFMYMMMWVFLSARGSVDDEPIGPGDAYIFRNITIICVAIGGISCLVFHLVVHVDEQVKPVDVELSSIEGGKSTYLRDCPGMTREASQKQIVKSGISSPPDHAVVKRTTETSAHYGSLWSAEKLMTVSNWLRKPQFWKVFVQWMCVNLFTDLSQSYMALYLDVTLQLRPTNVAIVPLVMLMAGFFTSPLINIVTRIFGQRVVFCTSCLLGLGGTLWVWHGSYTDNSYISIGIYIVAVLYGSAGSAMVITGTASIADLIGGNVEFSALVFGMMGLGDKISNGIAFGVIQELVPDNDEAERDHYRNILVFVCGATALIAILVTLTMTKPRRAETISQKYSSDEETFSSFTGFDSSQSL